MKIAIATLQGRNYGGRLQNYALQTAIESLLNSNDSVKSLRFIHGKSPLYPTLISRCRQYSIKEILHRWWQNRNEDLHKQYIDDVLKTRFAMFDSFMENYIHRTDVIPIKDRKQLGGLFDVLVCGSDQIWNPNIVNDVFVGEGTGIKKRVSYAASIGRGYLSPYEANYLVSHLKDFDAISVREESAKKLLENAGLKKNIKVVLDPTLLLSKEKWSELTNERIVKDPYVFMYSFSNCIFKEHIIEKYKKEGKKMVYIPYAERVWNSYDGVCKMDPLYDIGPREFLSLIRYADIIYTDSFHGVALAIAFNKQFFVYERNKGGKTSMNSRIYDLLKTFGIGNRLIKSINSNYEDIDFDEVNIILSNLRKDSLSWLKTNLNY